MRVRKKHHSVSTFSMILHWFYLCFPLVLVRFSTDLQKWLRFKFKAFLSFPQTCECCGDLPIGMESNVVTMELKRIHGNVQLRKLGLDCTPWKYSTGFILIQVGMFEGRKLPENYFLGNPIREMLVLPLVFKAFFTFSAFPSFHFLLLPLLRPMLLPLLLLLLPPSPLHLPLPFTFTFPLLLLIHLLSYWIQFLFLLCPSLWILYFRITRESWNWSLSE